MPRADHHNEIELNYLERDSITYLLAGRPVTVRAGQLFLFWAAIPHQIIAHGGEAEYYVATIPFSWFLQCQLPAATFAPIFKGLPLVDVPVADQSDGPLFARWVEDLQGDQPTRRRAAFLEMQARLLRFSGGSLRSRRETKAKGILGAEADLGGLSHVEKMTCYIARHYREKITVEEIAGAAGLHPNYAMNLFRRTLHATMLDHLFHHRLIHAQRLLVSTQQKVVDLAFDSGFSSMSRFNEAFRKVCGCTPREFRRNYGETRSTRPAQGSTVTITRR